MKLRGIGRSPNLTRIINGNNMQNWFKFFGGEYLSDPKILSLSPAERSCWVTILCYASISDIPGEIKYLTEERIMIMSGLDATREEWNETKGVLDKLQKFKMIQIDNEMITVINYRKRQDSALTAYERVRKYREMKRIDNEMITLPQKVKQNDNARREENRIEEKRIEKNKKKRESRFAPPSLKEVSDYCKERENGVNSRMFIDFYSAKGWLIGKNKMKDWRAAVRTWEARNPIPPKPVRVLPDKPITPEEIKNRKRYLDKIRKNLPLAGVERSVVKKLD